MSTDTQTILARIALGWPPIDDPNADGAPSTLAAIGAESFAMLRNGTWLRICGFDAGLRKAQVVFVGPGASRAVYGTIDARAQAVRALPPGRILALITGAIATRHEAAEARQAALASIRKGARMEFTNSKTGAVVVGTVTRVNTKTVSLLEDNGNEWRVTPGLLRVSTVAAPVALPEHPTMARWSLGTVRYGLNGLEGRSWEQPLLLDGKRVGMLRDRGDGGSVDIDCTPAMHSARLCADAKAWATAVGEEADGEAYALWAEWTTNDRPFGRAYQTLEQRYGKG